MTGIETSPVPIRPTTPDGMASNFLETIPGIDLFIGWRTYGPEARLFDGTYRMPRFERKD